MGLYVVLRDTATGAVHVPEVGLRAGVPLLSRQPIPAHRFDVVFRDAAAFGVDEPEDVLRGGVSLVSRQSVPTHRFGVVLRHACAGAVLEPDVVLRLGVALLSPRTLRNAPLYPERPPVVWSRGVQRRGRTGGRVELVELPHPRAPRLVELGRLHHAGHRDRVDGAVQS